MTRLVRYLWAMPNTLLGLIFCLAAIPRGRVSIVDGVVEAHGPLLRWALRRLPPIGGASAVTLGHVVLGCDGDSLDWARSHEQVHVAQYERWGPFFLPAYFGASAWAALSGRHFYRDNVFEVEAFAFEGDVTMAGNPKGLPLQNGQADEAEAFTFEGTLKGCLQGTDDVEATLQGCLAMPDVEATLQGCLGAVQSSEFKFKESPAARRACRDADVHRPVLR